MFQLFVLLFLSFVAPGIRSEHKTVEYYLDLFAEYQAKVANFSFPTNNSEFFGNSNNKIKYLHGIYDFIIVGAGSSGSALANRLSEVADWRILLIEAGKEDNDFSDIPNAFAYLQASEMNWGYLTTPQTTCCLGMKNNQCVYPRGKVMGGSSTINALMYVRGTKQDYDHWQDLGNDGWNYSFVLPYLMKSEGSQIYLNSEYHGTDGPLTVNTPTPPPGIMQTFLDANREANRTYVDYNGEHELGYSHIQSNIRNGKRANGNRAYLKPIVDRTNLIIQTNAMVTKILTSTLGKRSVKHHHYGGKNKNLRQPQADGVEFVINGKTYTAYATRDIILSAGSINTPQILKLSGIGPKDELTKLDIPVVKDLPAVGRNLKDHPVFVGLTFRTNVTSNLPALPEMIKEYLNEGKGGLTASASVYGIGFLEVKDNPINVPDLEYIFISHATSGMTDLLYNANEQLIEEYFSKLNASTDFTIFLVLLHPKSSGDVTLKSNSPIDFPNININYFSDEMDEDVETMYRGIQFLLGLTKTEAFKKLNTTHFAPIPGCEEHEMYSKDYWYCIIRRVTSTLYHPVGTTRMGVAVEDSVVDNQLKVHGMSYLRIADAGVMPSTVSGHTNAPSFMIGERAADFIKGTYLKK